MLMLGLATFTFVCFAWVFFRARTFEQAFAFASAMLGLASSQAERLIWTRDFGVVLVLMGLMLTIHWCLRERTLEAVADKFPWWVRSALLATMLLAIATMTGEDRAFIYFQF